MGMSRNTQTRWYSVWEADEIGDGRVITYRLCPVCLSPYQSCPECCRPFAGLFLLDRIMDTKNEGVFTSDEGKRGGRTLPHKQIVEVAARGVVFFLCAPCLSLNGRVLSM
ncbi:hypothetical protein PsorP6_002941 [Peronosclerospora sorghi]|uniref:Uncharacterized protein n=1 Tax=Peronosclerospora sorghi TaxID=230839 RepID=A0ACC0VPW8_9STRA|nr:hypothetical protein PsorP6_002941 [Peronosclerospora sorghi]